MQSSWNLDKNYMRVTVMSEDKRICRICGKEYDHDGTERTLSALVDGTGTEYVVCEICFNKFKEAIEKKVKYKR